MRRSTGDGRFDVYTTVATNKRMDHGKAVYKKKVSRHHLTKVPGGVTCLSVVDFRRSTDMFESVSMAPSPAAVKPLDVREVAGRSYGTGAPGTERWVRPQNILSPKAEDVEEDLDCTF